VTAPRRPVELPPVSASGSDVEAARRGRRRCCFDDGPIEAPVYDWERLEPGHRIVGAAVVDDPTTSVLVPPGFDCTVDAYRNLVLRPVVAGNGRLATK
jgi:N-methylhydantoinase A/oxoprolinase/acetone carboxylase beta subunit